MAERIGFPVVVRPSYVLGGRGMAIVDALASAWGTDQEPTHKIVWFELALPESNPNVERPVGVPVTAAEQCGWRSPA